MIEILQVSKTFHTKNGNVEAVKDVTVKVEKGEIFGIIGSSGAGKSTLVRCINLLEVPTAGTVVVDGETLTGLSEKKLRAARKNIGMIFQHFNLMPSRTVFANVAYPLRYSGYSKAEIKERVLSLLELVEIKEKANAYPSQLSGGQKQRVAIARALACQPQVLLCDEATSALDPQTTYSILKLIKKLNQQLGITVVIITHEMSVVKEICHRVAVMEKGQVVEQGAVFDIFAKPQQQATKDLIATTSNLHKIYDLLAEDSPIVQLKQSEIIVRLTYLQKTVSDALISDISRRYNLNVNIIFSDIEIIQDSPIGGLVAVVNGSRENIEEMVRYLVQQEIGVEVIKDGRTAAANIA